MLALVSWRFIAVWWIYPWFIWWSFKMGEIIQNYGTNS